MSRHGPVLTLLAVAVLAAVLFVVNVTRAEQGTAPVAAPASPPPSAAPPTGAAPPSAAPPAGDAVAPAPVVARAAYAGRSAGDEVTVAIAVEDGRAVAYVCDGRRVEAWLEGTLTGDRLALQGRNGAALDGTVSPRATFGSVSVGSAQWPFSAMVATPPSGLYEGRADVRGVANRIGWIVLQDGNQVGVRRAAGADPQAAPSLDPTSPDSVTVDGAPVEVRVLTGGDHVIPR